MYPFDYQEKRYSPVTNRLGYLDIFSRWGDNRFRQIRERELLVSNYLAVKKKPLVALPALSTLIVALSVLVAQLGSDGGNTLLLVLIIGMIFLAAVGMGVALALSRKTASPLNPEGE